MSNLVIYDVEREAGLSDLILASTSVQIDSPVKIITDGTQQLKLQLKNDLNKIIATNLGQPDLHYLDTVLVSVGWNNNDDVFLKDEVYAARHTAEDKPFNYEHNENDVIGHITGCEVIDDTGLVLADDLDMSKVPDSFHIKTSAVLYKHWEDKAKAERIVEIIKEIAEDKWFVSMEALMTNFDYALKNVNTNEQKIVARTQSTAFLTKHLRRFKGTGRFEDYEVGRILRHITFAGKGLVRRPANPKSVILTSTASAFNGVTANLKTENDIMSEQSVAELSKELASLQREIVKANTERDQALATIDQMNSQQTAVKIQSLEGAVTARDEKIKELTSTAAQLQTSLDEAIKAKTQANDYEEEAKKKYKEASAKLEELEAQTKSQARVAALVEAGHAKEAAEATVKSLAGLSDDQFNAVVVIAKNGAKMEKDEDKKGDLGKGKAADKGSDDDDDDAEAKLLEAAKAEQDINLGGDTGNHKVLAAKLVDDLSNLFKSKVLSSKTTANNKK